MFGAYFAYREENKRMQDFGEETRRRNSLEDMCIDHTELLK